MKQANGEGGGSWGCGVAGTFCRTTPEYDVWQATSTSTLLFIQSALKHWDVIEKEYTTSTNRDMYGRFHPFNRKGKMSKVKLGIAFSRFLAQKKRNYLFDISIGIENKLRKNFTKDDFNWLRRQGIDVIVTSKNANRLFSGTTYTSVLDDEMDYETFLGHSIASASIPGLSKPRRMPDNCDYVDGGVLERIATRGTDKYKDYKKDVWMMHSIQDEVSRFESTDGLQLFVNLFNDMRYEIGQGDLAALGNNHKIYYSEKKEFSAAYFNPDMMREAFDIGYNKELIPYKIFLNKKGVLDRKRL